MSLNRKNTQQLRQSRSPKRSMHNNGFCFGNVIDKLESHILSGTSIGIDYFLRTPENPEFTGQCISAPFQKPYTAIHTRIKLRQQGKDTIRLIGTMPVHLLQPGKRRQDPHEILDPRGTGPCESHDIDIGFLLDQHDVCGVFQKPFQNLQRLLGIGSIDLRIGHVRFPPGVKEQ